MKKHVEVRLAQEFIKKNRATSLTFAATGFWYFFYSWGPSTSQILLQVLCSIIFVSSLVRYLLADRFEKGREKNLELTLSRVRVLAYLNAALWFMVFSTSILAKSGEGQSFLVPTMISIAFSAASLLTLSSHRDVFIFFNVMMMAPIVFPMLIAFSMNGDQEKLWIAILNIIHFVYLLKQSKVLLNNSISLYEKEEALETSNRQLRKSQEALEKQTAQMIHSARLASLGEMSSEVAHEINNPLAVMNGHLQLLEMNLQNGPLKEELIRERVTKITASLQRIMKIIRGLRQYSKLSDRDAYVSSTLAAILNDTLDFCSEKLRTHNVSLKLQPYQDVSILCRPIQISQILINIINNAIDSFSDAQEVKKVSLEFQYENGEVSIRISNNGQKIPIDLQSRLFQAFFTTKENGKGTGLGLSISRGIAVEHGGELYFDQNQEETTFVLVLPFVDQTKPLHSPKSNLDTSLDH